MDYHFIEYRANEMIDGDWRWYLETYATEPSGMRTWIKDGQLITQAYEAPTKFKRHVLTAITFVPMRAPQEERHLPRPRDVRWGIVTCLRKDLVDLIGPALSDHATLGQLRLREGVIVPDWIPVIFNRSIRIPIGQADGPAATARRLRGDTLGCSERYSLIVRDDIFQGIRGFQFKGCRIQRCGAADGSG